MHQPSPEMFREQAFERGTAPLDRTLGESGEISRSALIEEVRYAKNFRDQTGNLISNAANGTTEGANQVKPRPSLSPEALHLEYKKMEQAIRNEKMRRPL